MTLLFHIYSISNSTIFAFSLETVQHELFARNEQVDAEFERNVSNSISVQTKF
jgi:hypothetical protein